MSAKLFSIVELFEIPGRGLIVVTDTAIRDVPKLLVGQKINYRKLNGDLYHSFIRGIEMISPFDSGRSFCFLAEENLTKTDLPIGTEVWQVGEL
ncbi:hypothetical protein Plim_1661 [Planctopirus limnophila DSM 3776]|uniref:Uncharacterized protein n=1 Tax=Planctopirus limnophila (strain ATCC 43296 / DSM 3776 / IFAM 1008 / Mu 290) TaxID=521674 RepID=D5SWZ3_PLAL2|nr:hypothetical protein [Planctopirus limnophila]ADG67493.1 hypothetical protein Plim_1661 [Planctopirus limnophila DSM 3776]